MESVLTTIFSTENVRTLATLVSVFSCFVWLKTSLERKIGGVDKRIDGIESSIKELKYNDLAAIHRRIDDLKNNDFAHLTSTIEALTYALEKNGSLKPEDKEFVDSRLAR